MKKVLSVLMVVAAMMFATNANAQIKFGLKGGLDVTNMSLSNDVFDASNKYPQSPRSEFSRCCQSSAQPRHECPYRPPRQAHDPFGGRCGCLQARCGRGRRIFPLSRLSPKITSLYFLSMTFSTAPATAFASTPYLASSSL